ncbi:MAG: ABC transporter permease [Actinomycetales bacterium]|nr:ABC transporter permease [Actinomycetales bacterium]
MTTPTSMNTTAGTTTARTRHAEPTRGYRITGLRLLRSELIRFTTVRSNVITVAALGLLMVLIGVIAAATSTGAVTGVGPGGAPAPGFAGTGPLATVLAGSTPGVLVVGVLGVLVGAREYGSGMIRTTMTADPRRIGAFLARIGAFIAVVMPATVLASLVAYGAGTAMLSAGGAPTAAWGDPGVARAVIGTGVYLAGVGLLGLCLGVLTRSIGQGVGWLVGLVMVLPGFGALLLPDDWQHVAQYFPSNAGAAFTTITESSSQLGAGPGAAVFLAWVVGLGTVAAVMLRRRDV